MEDQNYYIAGLQARLSPARFAHSLAVVETALVMGETLGQTQQTQGLNREKIWLAALLHDYAKDLPDDELLTLAEENKLITCKAEVVQPDLLHGPVGAFLCRRDLQLEDQEVLRAIHYHTTGYENMTLLDQIVFLADLVEPGRNYAGVDELRKICEDNLDTALLCAFDGTLQYVLRRKMLIHPLTVMARNSHLLGMLGEK